MQNRIKSMERSETDMKDKITAANSFKTKDSELLKKAVTEKVRKLINVRVRKTG